MGKKNRNKKPNREELLELILRPVSEEQMESLSRNDLLILLRGEQYLRKVFEEGYYQSQAMKKELEDKAVHIEGVLVKLKNRLFSPASEKSSKETKNQDTPPSPPSKKRPIKRERNLQNRYPGAQVIEQEVRLETLPRCTCCSEEMSEMNVFEQSEHLITIEKKYVIKNIQRMKYHCQSCHGHIETAPAVPRVVPRSVYGDSFLIDVAISKFCDLIPIERYCEMAARAGFTALPSTSLHEGVARLAVFFTQVYERIRIETLDSRILQGDETTHQMFEQGDENIQWYLWGFFGAKGCFYEYHDTRAGRVAGDVLSESSCDYFISDAYSGYGKAIRETNELREIAGLPLVKSALCNAHSRRGFKEQKDNLDADFFIQKYKLMYANEKEVKELLKEEKLSEAGIKRREIEPYFKEMKDKAKSDFARYSSHHGYSGAMKYFLNNYEDLTVCLEDPRIPLDNNTSERGLRSAVVGRKTWYGTHSERGAETSAIHFTLIESCKINKVNPRVYYKEMVENILYKRPIMTPFEYKNFKNQKPESS